VRENRTAHCPIAPEATFRRALRDDPNDERIFAQLVSLLAGPPPADDSAIRNVTWSLAEELAQRPQAWFPLLELARLSLDQNGPVIMPRIQAAIQRESTGRAITRAAALLRAAGHPDEAFRLALAHWRPGVHKLAAGRQLILASIEAGRVPEARQHLRAVVAAPRHRAWWLQAELAWRQAVHRTVTRARAVPTTTRARPR
jgi:hypothetical protein